MIQHVTFRKCETNGCTKTSISGMYHCHEHITGKHNNSASTASVYFIFAEEVGRIKVGYSKNIDTRIGMMRTGSPVGLQVIHRMKGNIDLESKIHNFFSEKRLHGEWFKADDELMEFIEDAKLNGVDWVLKKLTFADK